MAIDVKFLAALSDINKLKAQSEGRDAALDALINVTPYKDKKKFAKVVRAHIEFWNRVEPHLVSSEATLKKTKLVEIRQKAAEQRIVLGLNNASIEVLVAILTHNDDACREYISSQKMLPLDSAVANTSTKNKGALKKNNQAWGKLTGILTNSVLVAIKTAVTQQLFTLAVIKLDEISDSTQLNDIKKLVDDNDINGLINRLFAQKINAIPAITIPPAFKETLDQKIAAITSLPDTELFDLFLSVEKSNSLAADHRSFSELQRYFSLIKNASGLADFLRKCPDASADEQQLKKELASRLTDDLFNSLQQEVRSAALLKSHDKARDSLKEIDKELKQLAKGYEPLIKQLSELNYLATLEPGQLAGPTFQAKASVDAKALRAKYAALAEQCNLVCEQLKRDYHTLNLYLNSLPSQTQLAGMNPLDKQLGGDNLKKIKVYEGVLPAEMTKIKTALEHYLKLQHKATDITKVLDHAAEGGVYRKVRNGVTCRAVPHQKNDASTSTVAAQMTNPPARENWQLLKTSEHESAFIFDTEHNNPDKQVQIRGRFSQTYPQDVLAAPVSIQEGEKKPPVCRIEANQVPTFTKPLQGGDAAELEHARVKFFMEMAAALLAANHGKAPTKDNPIHLYGSDPNDIKFLWTALVLLGEGKPAFGKEAISVHASSFNPKNEEGRFFGYSNSSLYHTVFKKYKDDVVAVRDNSQQALADDGHVKATKVMEQFKSGLERAKFDPKAVNKLVAEEGPAPEPRGMHK